MSTTPFKMNGPSGFGDKLRVKRAKRLVRKNIAYTTVDTPTDAEKETKALEKIEKAGKLLEKAGYSDVQIEKATGAAGYETAKKWAEKKKRKK